MISIHHQARRELHGSRLKIAAWSFEILAASVGLFIALVQSQLLSALTSNTLYENQEWMDILIGFVPMLMIAFAELLKIPFVDAIFIASTKFWRFIFIATLLFLTFITFQTVNSGLLRNYDRMNTNIDAIRDQYNNLTREHNSLEEKRLEIANNLNQSDNIENNHTNKLNEIDERKSNALAGLELERDQINEKIKNDSRILDLDKLIDDTENELKNTIKRELEIRENDRSNAVKALAAARLAEENINKEASNAVEDAPILRRDNEEKRYAPLIERAKFDVEEATIRLANIDNLEDVNQSENVIAINNRIETMSSQRESLVDDISRGLEDELIKLNNRQNDIIDNHSKDISDANEEYSIAKRGLSEAKSNITRINEKIDTLTQRIDDISAKFPEATKGNIIYRFARFVTGETDIAKIKPETITVIGTLWFGSIAVIVAAIGPLLAFAANVLILPPTPVNAGSEFPKKPILQKLLSSIRKYFVVQSRYRIQGNQAKINQYKRRTRAFRYRVSKYFDRWEQLKVFRKIAADRKEIIEKHNFEITKLKSNHEILIENKKHEIDKLEREKSALALDNSQLKNDVSALESEDVRKRNQELTSTNDWLKSEVDKLRSKLQEIEVHENEKEIIYEPDESDRRFVKLLEKEVRNLRKQIKDKDVLIEKISRK